MSLKTVKMKKAILSNAGSLGEVFAFKQLFADLEALVKQVHDVVAEEKRAELVKVATMLYGQLEKLTKELEKNTKEAVASGNKDLERQKNILVAQINQVNIELKDTLDQYKSEVLTVIDRRVQDVLKNAELFRGQPGKDGKPGVPGKDGSPDTPDQVVEKVNTASKKVKITAIEGLTDELRKARRENGGKSGGGMGNPQHEIHNVNSSSTVITLTYSPAAAGRAIWMYYQGQHLVYGTDFTVNERSVALLFTPVDNTYIDVTYLRG